MAFTNSNIATLSSTIIAGTSGGNFGFATANIGDINGDSYPDWAVGDTTNSKCYVFLGSSTLANVDATTLTGTNGGFIITGISGKALGGSVSGAGDINQNNYEDFIVGDPFSNTAYVIFGKNNGFTNIVASSLNGVNGGFVVTGASGGTFGASASGIGDIDDDGYSNWIVGDNTNSKAYIFDGKSSGFTNLDTTNAECTISGVVGGFFGSRVRGVRDINGDSYPDALINDNTNDKVYGLLGKSSTCVSTDATTFTGSNGGFIISGTPGGNFGGAISNVGKIYGTQFSGIAIGDSTNNKVYVFSSQSGNFANMNATTFAGTNSQFIISGAAGSGFGRSVSGVGDVDGDGCPDFAIGAHTESKVYVVFGRCGGSFTNLNATTFNGFNGGAIITGPAGSGFGGSISGLGNITGGVCPHFIIGASTESKAYIVPCQWPQPAPAPAPQPVPVPEPQPAPSPEPAPTPIPAPSPIPSTESAPSLSPLNVPLAHSEPQPSPIPSLEPTPHPYPQNVPQEHFEPELVLIPVSVPSTSPEPAINPNPINVPLEHPEPQPSPIPSPSPLPEPVLSPYPINVPQAQSEPQPSLLPEPFPATLPEPELNPYPVNAPLEHPEPQPSPLSEPSLIPVPEPEFSSSIPSSSPLPEPLLSPYPINVPVAHPEPQPSPMPAPSPMPEPAPSPQPLPTPAPHPAPSPEPVNVPLEHPAPQPSPTPAPSPMPEPAASPHPLPAPLPISSPEPAPYPINVPEAHPAPQSLPIPTPSPIPSPEPTPALNPIHVPLAHSEPQPSSMPAPLPTRASEPVSQPLSAPPPVPIQKPSPKLQPTPVPIDLLVPRYKCTCNTKTQVEQIKVRPISMCVSTYTAIYKCAEPDVYMSQAYCIAQNNANSGISIYHVEEMGMIMVPQDPMI